MVLPEEYFEAEARRVMADLNFSLAPHIEQRQKSWDELCSRAVKLLLMSRHDELHQTLIKVIHHVKRIMISTDMLYSSDNHIHLLVELLENGYIEISYEGFNSEEILYHHYCGDNDYVLRLRPEYIAIVEKMELRQHFKYLSTVKGLIAGLNSHDNLIEGLSRFIALLEDLAVETDKPQPTLSESFGVLRQEIGHFYNGIDPIEWVEEQRRD